MITIDCVCRFSLQLGWQRNVDFYHFIRLVVLWTDTEIFVYMDDAQKMFCREGGGIADSTSTICTMQVAAGDTYIDYDPRILKLRDLRRASDGRNVNILNFEDLGHPGRAQDDYGQSTSCSAPAA